MFLLKPPFIGDCLLPCLMKPEGKVLVAWMIWMIWMLEFRKCMKMHQVRNMQKDVLWMVGIPNSFPPKTGDRLICVWIMSRSRTFETSWSDDGHLKGDWKILRSSMTSMTQNWKSPCRYLMTTSTHQGCKHSDHWDILRLNPSWSPQFDLLRSAKKARRSKVHWHHPEGLEGPTRHSHLESGSIPNTQHHTT